MLVYDPICRRRGTAQLAVDIGLAVALVLVLAAVFALDHYRNAHALQVVQTGSESDPQAELSSTPSLGVAPAIAEYDDMGKLLQALGEGYKYEPFDLDGLQDRTRLNQFNVVFLTCSSVPESWLEKSIGSSARGGELFQPNKQVFGRVAENLRQFVAKGGTLYASDLHFPVLAYAFPEFVDLNHIDHGVEQTLSAEVLDPGLKELLGPQIPLRFDQSDWRPAAFAGETVTTFLQGTYRKRNGEQVTTPLLIKFPFKRGTVIFTSFHNEKQNSEMEFKLLRYLVFTAVTARVESVVNQEMARGGFSPAKRNLFSASAGAQSVAQTYHCAKAGHLEFVLGFRSQGARLKLSVTGPQGESFAKEGTANFSIDVPDAAAGDWKYTVTALELPNENFPFVVTVGRK